VCLYSQLRNFSSSEVAAMIEGLIRHDTEMRVEKNGCVPPSTPGVFARAVPLAMSTMLCEPRDVKPAF